MLVPRPGPGPCCCHLLKPTGRPVGSPWESGLFFFLLLFSFFPLCEGRGEQSVTLSLSYGGKPGRKSGCRITRPRWRSSDFCSSFFISPAWTPCLTAPSTFADALWLQRLRAAFEGTRLLPADPGALRGTVRLRWTSGKDAHGTLTFPCL